jgi:hypothetical protein
MQSITRVPTGTSSTPGRATSPVTVTTFCVTGLPAMATTHGVKGSHIGHQGPHLLGQPQGGNGAARDFVDQNVFITGRIKILQLGQFQGPVTFRRGSKAFAAAVYFRLMAMTPFGPGGLDHRQQGPNDFWGMAFHDILVRIEQRLALAAVRDNGFDLGVVFDVGRKSGPAFTDHPGFAHKAYKALPVHAFILKLSIGACYSAWMGKMLSRSE